MIIKFSKTYFILFILLLITEVLIALFAHDEIIRPYIGDLLVVILMYCCVKSFLNFRAIPVALSVLTFSYLIESLQYFQIVQILGLSNSAIANVIIGNYFSWIDILAYTLGTILIMAIEKLRRFHTRHSINYKYNTIWLFL
jgi:hypothetical protein